MRAVYGPQASWPIHHGHAHYASLTLLLPLCSGPLPSNDSGVPANSTNFFPSLRAMNISHNAFTGSLPAAFGQAGVFNQKPLQFADGEILMHVFDVSYNQLSGALPSFLDFTNVPEYVQRGIFIAVRRPSRLLATLMPSASDLSDGCLTALAL